MPRPCAFSVWISETTLRCSGTPSAAVGSSMIRTCGVPVDGAADRHRLALAAGEIADRRVEPGDVEVEPRHRLLRRLGHRLAVEHRQEAERLAHRLAAEEDVGADRQIVGEREVLVDRLDAVRARRLRRREVHWLALEADFAAIGLDRRPRSS